MNNGKPRIIDIAPEELKREMAEYGRQKASSVRSSRRFLRSVGMKIDSKGMVIS